MKCSAIQEQLLSAAIDGKAENLPAHLAAHLHTCEACRKEWVNLRGWTAALRAPDPWQPQGNFMDVLVERAMREKRRADLTEDTTRDLHLVGDESRFSWFSLPESFTRWAFSSALAIVLVAPLLFFAYGRWNTVGQFDYLQGNVIVMNGGSHPLAKESPVKRGATIQTPQQASTIIALENETELVIAPLSRVVIEDERNIRVERGKAYFDITPGHGEFHVTVPDGTVQVLGTAFEVSVEEGQSNITVTRGLVEITNGSQGLRVEGGQAGTLKRFETPIVKPVPSLIPTMRWVVQMRELKTEDDIRTYYPSLAAPTPNTGDAQ